jgi:hypothetical protein
MNKIAITICALAIGSVAALGLYLFLKGAHNVQMALASTAWPKASGMVVRSEVTTIHAHTRGGEVVPGGDTFHAGTVIRYTVNGREYTADTLYVGQSWDSSDKSEATLQRLRYPEGKAVAVSYNPGDPSIGVIKPGLHAEAFFLPLGGLGFLLPALMCLYIGVGIVRTDYKTDARAFRTSTQSTTYTPDQNESSDGASLQTTVKQGEKMLAMGVSVMGGLFLGLGVLAMTVGLQTLWQGWASQSWPGTEGVVIFNASGAALDETGREIWEEVADRGSERQFIYQYEVAGTTHLNNLQRFASTEEGRGSGHFPKGAKVKVHYFPTDPDVAVLEPGTSGNLFTFPVIGACLMLFSLGLFIVVRVMIK